MKKSITISLFLLLFTSKNYAFTTLKNIASPIDTCAEMTTLEGKIIEIKIIKMHEDEVVYQLCKDGKDAATRRLDLQYVKTIRVFNATKPEVDKLQYYLRQENIPKN